MKLKIFALFLILSLFNFTVWGKTTTSVRTIKLEDKDFDYQNLNNNPETILSGELDYDLDALNYLLKSSYGCYDDAVSRGFNPENFKKSIKEKFEGDDVIKTEDLTAAICEYIENYIVDSHFLIYCLGKNYSFERCHDHYFSSIILKKEDCGFKVVKSDEKDVKTGSLYTDDVENLLIYPAAGEDCYRLAASFERKFRESEENTVEKEISFDNQNVKVQFKYYSQLHYSGLPEFIEKETADTAYIKITNLVAKGYIAETKESAEALLNRYASCGEKYLNKKNIILDVRGNLGGNDTYSIQFLNSLCGFNVVNDGSNFVTKEEKFSRPILDWFKFNSIPGSNLVKTVEKAYRKNFIVIGKGSSKEPKKVSVPKFKGNLYVLMNVYSCSSGESTAFYSKKGFQKSDQVKVVGHNSAGALTCGDCLNFKLPNSGIGLYFGIAKFEWYIDGKREGLEGRGFTPDYWSSDEDMQQTLINLTGDEGLKRIDFAE